MIYLMGKIQNNNNKKDENVILNFFHFWVLKNSFSLNMSVCKQKSNIDLNNNCKEMQSTAQQHKW